MRRPVPRLVLLLCASLATAAHAEAPAFRVSPDTLRADEAGTWRASLALHNPTTSGMYPDSLSMEFANADPDRTDLPRSGTRSLDLFVRLMAPAGAGEGTGVEWTAPAEFEHGTLVFRFRAHDAHDKPYAFEARVPVVGGALGDRHPPILLEAAGQRTDMAIVEADSARRPAPALLYVPPAGTSARSLLRWCAPLAGRGYTMAVVSLPGSGRSTGEPDRAGPASVALVRAALDRLGREPSVDARRIVLWGQREGATTALLAAAGRADLAGVIAQDADFDPWAAYRALPPAERAAFAREAGPDSAAWRARSPLTVAERIPAPVLVLQTAEAPAAAGPATASAAAATAEAFAAARRSRDLYVETRLSPSEPHPLRRMDATRVALDFAARRTQAH